MKTTTHLSVAAVLTVLMQMGCQSPATDTRQILHLPELDQVRIEDAFWSPKLETWRKITANDVLDKFEGKYTPFPGWDDTRDAFRNFDRVAEGQRDIKQHDGPEWYDGLVYESIRGIADFLAGHPNKEMENESTDISTVFMPLSKQNLPAISTPTPNSWKMTIDGEIMGGSCADNTTYITPEC